ncbi:MAG: esterase/lipase family protein [Pseudomonadota bacterium]
MANHNLPTQVSDPSRGGYAALARDGAVGLVDKIESMHLAIAEQPLRALRSNPVTAVHAGLVNVAHRGVARAVYAGVRQGLNLALTLADAWETGARAQRGPGETPSQWWHSALSGVLGDYLHDSHSRFASSMDCLIEGERSGRHLVVFVHGLCCDERAWRLGAERHWGNADMHYGRQLEERGYRALYVRYNSGLSLADNGQQLHQLLDRLVADWPEPVESLQLVGHSMGGLLSRSAVHAAVSDADGGHWVQTLHQVACLGSPHSGSYVERGADMLSGLMAFHPVTRPVAEVVALRSSGIRDLGESHIGEGADWPEHTALHYVYTSLASCEHHPVSRRFGDTLVDVDSGAGRSCQRYAEHEQARRHFLPGLHHMHLLNHPRVAELLHDMMPERH